MKIEELELPVPAKRWKKKYLCSKKVAMAGTTYFDNKNNQCRRAARFKVGNKQFCVQHAGECALKHLMDNQDI